MKSLREKFNGKGDWVENVSVRFDLGLNAVVLEIEADGRFYRFGFDGDLASATAAAMAGKLPWWRRAVQAVWPAGRWS